MNAKSVADAADMIVAGYAFTIKEDYVEVVDLSDVSHVLTIQNGSIAESLMSDEEESRVLGYYQKNRSVLEESVYA